MNTSATPSDPPPLRLPPRLPKLRAPMQGLASGRPQAPTLDTWLPAAERVSPPPPQPGSLADRMLSGCILIESICSVLRPAPSATHALYERLASRLDLVGVLPAYSVDAPEGAAGSEATKSLTELLKQHGSPISARAANKMLEASGVLERQERASSNGRKGYWCITREGEQFGKNLTHPENPRETQPHFYLSRFADLVKRAGLPVTIAV